VLAKVSVDMLGNVSSRGDYNHGYFTWNILNATISEPHIHTYKFDEGVEDKVVLDLIYEARDIDQRLGSEDKVDDWFFRTSSICFRHDGLSVSVPSTTTPVAPQGNAALEAGDGLSDCCSTFEGVWGVVISNCLPFELPRHCP
jgi:hypothetical protein